MPACGWGPGGSRHGAFGPPPPPMVSWTPLSSCSYVIQQDLGVFPARDTHPSPWCPEFLWSLTMPTCVTGPSLQLPQEVRLCSEVRPDLTCHRAPKTNPRVDSPAAKPPGTRALRSAWAFPGPRGHPCGQGQRPDLCTDEAPSPLHLCILRTRQRRTSVRRAVNCPVTHVPSLADVTCGGRFTASPLILLLQLLTAAPVSCCCKE